METFASNQANIVPQRFRLLQLHRRLLFGAAVFAIMAITGVVTSLVLVRHGGKVTPSHGVGVVGVATAASLRQLGAKFRKGDLMAGIVTSVSPLRIAALADLRKQADGPDFFAVGLVKAPRAAFAGEVRVGDAVPMCALYDNKGGKRALHWSGFSPEPVQVATADAKVVEDAARRVEPGQWALLKAALAQLPPDARPGMYRVDVSSLTGTPSGWPRESIGQCVMKGGAVKA